MLKTYRMDSQPIKEQVQTTSVEETEALGQALGQVAKPGDIVGLSGDLGAGKTQFTRGVARGLDADERYRVVSPTFTLINEHPGRVKLIHVDLYRLSDPEEMMEIGLFDYMGGDGICVIEWFERLEEDRPSEYLSITMEAIDDEVRIFTIEGSTDRYRQRISDWLSAYKAS